MLYIQRGLLQCLLIFALCVCVYTFHISLCLLILDLNRNSIMLPKVPITLRYIRTCKVTYNDDVNGLFAGIEHFVRHLSWGRAEVEPMETQQMTNAS